MKITKQSGWSGTKYELFPEVGEHDLEISLDKAIKQVDAELRQRGLNPQKLSSNAAAALRRALSKS